jgi:predicted PurR-regulated permease PerM
MRREPVLTFVVVLAALLAVAAPATAEVTKSLTAQIPAGSAWAVENLARGDYLLQHHLYAKALSRYRQTMAENRAALDQAMRPASVGADNHLEFFRCRNSSD